MSHQPCGRQPEYVMPTSDDAPLEGEVPETDARDAVLFTFSDSEDGLTTGMASPVGPDES